MTWGKLEESIRVNGKVAEAGRDGALLFIALLTLHTAKGRAGVIPASVCKPARLRVEAFAFLGTFTPDEIECALGACVRAELCAVRADGAIELRGWSDDHAVACSHCRKPNPEPSNKTCPDCREGRKVQRKDERKPSNDKGSRKPRADGATRAQNGAERAQEVRAPCANSALVCVSVSDNPPYPPEGERAAARGASAARPDPEPEPAPSRPDSGPPPSIRDASPIADLTAALLRTRYRAGIGNAIVRRGEVRDRAAELVQTGFTIEHLNALLRLADAKTDGDPGALLAHWLDQGIWREVLDEQGEKSKHRAAQSRGKAAQPEGDTLAGIYGETSKPAASAIGQVLRNVAGGAS